MTNWRPRSTLSTGSVRAHLSDEGGRIDIGKAPVEVLVALFRSVGAPAGAADTIARAIVEWRGPVDADRPNAPPDPPDGSAKKTNVDQPFTDIRQLAQIPGMPPEWVTAIAPLATVYGSETVNPLTAPARVLAALPGVDAAGSSHSCKCATSIRPMQRSSYQPWDRRNNIWR